MKYETDNISHHGILGMKWGQRNGPPYPLGASDHSKSEKKAGWKRSLSKSDGSLTKKGKRKYRKGQIDEAEVVGGNLTPHRKDTLTKNAQKSQKAYDRVTRGKWHVAWNEAAERFNDGPELRALNEKFSLEERKTWEKTGPPEKFTQEYNKLWGKCYADTFLEIFGERPVE